MTLRTRVAIIVILLLVGWIFASPFRNSPTLDGGIQTSKAVLPLQIQSERPQMQMEASGWTDEPVPAHTAIDRITPISDVPPPLPPSVIIPTPEPFIAQGPRLPLKPVTITGVEFKENQEKAPQPIPSTYATFPLPKTLERPVTYQSHRIVNGDSLTSLAKLYFKDTQFALAIYEANRHVLASPEILPIGAELRIPDLVSKANTSAMPPPPALTPTAAPPLEPNTGPRPLKSSDDLGWRTSKKKSRGLNGL